MAVIFCKPFWHSASLPPLLWNSISKRKGERLEWQSGSRTERGIVICYVQLLVMILPIIPTEISLRKNFDRNGNKRGKTEKK